MSTLLKVMVLFLVFVGGRSFAFTEEEYKGVQHSYIQVKEIEISSPITWISVINEKCIGLPTVQAAECAFDFKKQKIEEDMRFFGPISKNVENLYVSKIGSAIGVKVSGASKDRRVPFRLYVEIKVSQHPTPYFGKYAYHVNHVARLEEKGVGVTGRKGNMTVMYWLAGGTVFDTGSIEGEIYRSVDKIVDDMKNSFAHAREYCMKEKCTNIRQP